MGKTKNRRYRTKDNPTGLPSVKSVELEDDQSSASSKNEHIIHTIMEQLETPGVDSKLCALNTLSSMTDDEGFVEEFLTNNTVKIVGPLLVDHSPAVREAAAVAFRNLSGMGKMEICDMLVEEDILTYVFALFNKLYSSNWLPPCENGDVSAMEQDNSKKKKNKGKKGNEETSVMLIDDFLVSTFIQGVNILWNVCKSSDRAVEIFNRQNILPILSRCLDPKECGIEAAVAVAHCLQAVTENNEVAAHELWQTSEEVLLRILSPAFEEERNSVSKPYHYLLLRVLASGIVMNITKGSSNMSPVLNISFLLAISDAISEDHQKTLSDIYNFLMKEKEQTPISTSPDDEESVEAMDEDYSVSNLINEAESLIMAQTIAVELLTNLFFSEDGDSDLVDSDCEDLPNAEAPCNGNSVHSGLPEMDEAIGEKVKIENILKKVEKDDMVWNELESHLDTQILISKVNTLRCRSLLCLHNVITSLQDEDLGGFDGSLSLWEKLGNIVCKEENDDLALLEAATAAMRAISERILRMDPKSFASNLGMTKFQVLLNVAEKCGDSKTKVNIIRTVGIMGEALSHSSSGESIMLLAHVGSFLLQVSIKPEEELWVVAEALDTLMDVFAEDSTDPAAVQIGLVDSLKTILPTIRSKLRQQRKSLGHHAAIISTAKTNLERFVEYKIEHIFKNSPTT